MGYGKPEAEVWLSKVLQRTRKSKNNTNASFPPRRRHMTVRRKTSASAHKSAARL
jgi:hypothetical protein